MQKIDMLPFNPILDDPTLRAIFEGEYGHQIKRRRRSLAMPRSICYTLRGLFS